MRSVLYGVGVYDAPTLAPVTVFATAVPARRTSRVERATTLRQE